MKDRIPKYPGRVRLVPVPGKENTYDMIRADEAEQVGTPLIKANLLSDVAVNAMHFTPEATPSNVFESMSILQGKGKPDSSISADRVGREYWDSDKKQLYKYVESSSGVFEWVPSAIGTIEEIVETVMITESGVWTPPSNMIGDNVFITVVGGGGGVTTGSEDTVASGYGGGGGGYVAEAMITLRDKNPVQVTIGAGGKSGGKATGDSATSGGVTSFGNYISASGGGIGGGTYSDRDTGGDGGSGGGGGRNQRDTSGTGGNGDFGGGGGGGGEYGDGGNGGTYGGGGGKGGGYGTVEGGKGGKYGGDGGKAGQAGFPGTNTIGVPGLAFTGEGKGGAVKNENPDAGSLAGGGGGGYGGNGGDAAIGTYYAVRNGGGGGGGYGGDGGKGDGCGGGGGGYGGKGDDGFENGGGGGGYGPGNYGKGCTFNKSESKSGICVVRYHAFKVEGLRK